MVSQIKDYLVKTLEIYDGKILHTENNLWQITWASTKDIQKIGIISIKIRKNAFYSGNMTII